MIDHAEMVRHGDSLRALARAIVGSSTDADDVVQDAWVAAMRAPPGTAVRSPLGWLRGAVRHLAKTRGRRAVREAGRLGVAASPLAADERLEPDAIATQAETAARVTRAVCGLPAHYREVVVRRYWHDLPPRDIARELGLPVKTVHNRLHLALTRLRAELGDAAVGGDGLRALLVLATPGGLRDLSVASSIGGSGGGVVAGGGVALATLTIMKTKTAAALTLATLAVFGWVAFDTSAAAPFDDSGTVSRGDGPFVTAADADPAPATAAEREDDVTEAARRSASEPAAAVASEAMFADASVATEPGRVRLEVVDEWTGAHVEPFELRLLSNDRFASRRAASPLEVQVSPGEYEVLVAAAGYEPIETEPIAVTSDGVVDLGRVVLRRGYATVIARVHVHARANGDDARGEVAIELYGDGRNECAACLHDPAAPNEAGEAPCPTCGYAPARSLVRTRPGVGARFDRLASGGYSLVVRGADGVILGSESIVVEAGAVRVVDLDLRFRDLEVLLLDERGQPFDGVWLEDGAEVSDRLRLFFWSDEILSATADHAPIREARASRISNRVEESAEPDAAEPALPGRPAAVVGVVAQGGIEADERRVRAAQLRGGRGEEPDRVDVQRSPGHVLWPSPITAKPKLRSAPLRIDRVGSGHYVVRDVPAASNQVQLTCGPAFSRRVDIATDSAGPTEIALRTRCGITSAMLEQMKPMSCTSCHALPSALLPN